VLLSLLSLLAACAGEPASGGGQDVAAPEDTAGEPTAAGGGQSAADAEPLKVGAVFNLTGPGAVLGADEVRGAQVFVDSVNAEGGLDGRQIELTVIDAESDPQKAADAVARLIERDGVSAVIGPDGTPTTLAAVPVANRQQVPLISTGGAWPYGLSGEELEWVFTATPSTSEGLDAYVDYWESIGVERVAVIGADTPFLEVPRRYFEERTDLPVELVALEAFPPGATDITAQATTVRDADPDFILSWSTGPDGVTTLRALDALGIDIPRGLNGGTTTKAFEDIAGPLLEGVTAFTYKTQVLDELDEDDPVREQARAYLDAMEAAGEDTFGGGSNAVMAWEAMLSVTEAVREAGATDPAALHDALEQQEFAGAITVWQRTPDDHEGAEGGYVIVQHENGEWSLAGDA
jgi:branched-chain amino acid transport system substrate-binding protein